MGSEAKWYLGFVAAIVMFAFGYFVGAHQQLLQIANAKYDERIVQLENKAETNRLRLDVVQGVKKNKKIGG